MGATTSLINLFILVITGFTLGISIYSAHEFGKGNNPILKKILSSFAVIMGILFSAIAFLGIAAMPNILLLLQTSTEIFEMSKSYICIILLEIPFLAVYNVYCAVLRGIGNSSPLFLAVLISSAANVTLDILLVYTFKLGVEGAAIATVISQIAMTIFYNRGYG